MRRRLIAVPATPAWVGHATPDDHLRSGPHRARVQPPHNRRSRQGLPRGRSVRRLDVASPVGGQRHPYLRQARDPFTPPAKVDGLERPWRPAHREVRNLCAPMPDRVHPGVLPEDAAIGTAHQDPECVLEDAVLATSDAHNTRAQAPAVQGQAAIPTAAYLGCLGRRRALPQVDRQPIVGHDGEHHIFDPRARKAHVDTQPTGALRDP
jgi:hypothetical protein